MNHQKNDVYLCQVSETVSCGACCGLYNVPDASFEGLFRMLRRRSMVFSTLPRTMDAILDFGREETANLGEPPMPEFHHCPYIGLIGEGLTRVGCLLHPQAPENAGVDYRGLSHYGSMTCGMYFCPSHRNLPENFKKIIRNLADDWYAYGLLISEPILLKAIYGEIIKRAAVTDINPERAGMPGNRSVWAELFTLKTKWPFRAESRPLAGYFFNDPLYPKPAVNYDKTDGTVSKFDSIFRELHSQFNSSADLATAEEYLGRLLDDFSATIA
ncbi:MAG: hypothetical protein C4518_09945 [Desulfobacteraceae bacterium]|nr:MAG: hypothetical protein C4518_09945 [Desulfobacteraceae bacterium]